MKVATSDIARDVIAALLCACLALMTCGICGAALAEATDMQGGAPSGDSGGAPGGDSGGAAPGGDSGEPPSGDSDGPGDSGGAAPGGDSEGGDFQSGDMPDGLAPGGDFEDEGSAPDGDSENGDSAGAGGGGADTMSFDYDGTYTGVIVADGEEVSETGGTYAASDSDQNAALAENGGVLTLDGSTMTKSGDDTDGDRCNFYGANAIALAVGESSKLVISDSDLDAESEGSNGLFSTDSATLYAYGIDISTTADNSRGLDATYGGTIVASDVVIDTMGSHCAGVATDRGGGFVSLTDSTIQTAGSGSPVLYSTGDVEVSGVTGEATGSQICGMEGTNTILVNDSSLTSTVTSATASDPIADGIIIYQSTSGDAEASTGDVATFQAAGSTLSSAIESGSMFYFTNTSADVVLSETTLDFDSEAANLILAAGNDANNWGSAGTNGATVTFTALAEELAGTVEADTISSVALFLADGTTWTGDTVVSENAAGQSTSDTPLTVCIDSESTWVVTGDCELSALTVADGGQVVDSSGETVSIVSGGETVVEGTGDVTVTVTGSYATDYDESSEGALATSLIDRSDFDDTFGTSTIFTMGASGLSEAGETAIVQGGESPWAALLEFFEPLISAFREAWVQAQGEDASGETADGTDGGTDGGTAGNVYAPSEGASGGTAGSDGGAAPGGDAGGADAGPGADAGSSDAGPANAS